MGFVSSCGEPFLSKTQDGTALLRKPSGRQADSAGAGGQPEGEGDAKGGLGRGEALEPYRRRGWSHGQSMSSTQQVSQSTSFILVSKLLGKWDIRVWFG